MSTTVVGLNDPKAVNRFSTGLAVDTAKKAYWQKKFMAGGDAPNAPVQLKKELESDAGDKISFDLSVQLKMEPVEGDDVLENQEEDLTFYTDEIYVDQIRGGVNTGGRMTRKRTLHNLRKIAKERQSEWWARVCDEIMFCYAAGARGANGGFLYPTTWTGRANNPLQSPDAKHQLYAGSATSKATLTASDKMSTNFVERLSTRAEVMGGGTEEIPEIQPIMIDGEEHFVLVMHPWAAYDLRTSAGTNSWTEFQKAAMTAEGRSNPIFKGGLGMINNVVLHSHKSSIIFNDYGAGSDVAAARSLFLGRQALCMAFGTKGTGMRFGWHEESRDNGNQVVISTSAIMGTKKSRFDGKDFGVLAADHAAADPS